MSLPERRHRSPSTATEPADRLGDDGRRGSGTDLGCVVGLVLLATIAFTLIRPTGEFALNDDWAYVLPVKWLSEQGRLQFTDWQYMTLIGQVLMGTAVASVTGYSITALRWMVIGLAVISTLLVFATARATRATRSASVWAALLLLCNPIFLLTAASFMTDVPFLAACLAAVACRVAAQGRFATARLLLAWFFVALACSIRQSGIVLAVGFIVFDWVERRSPMRVIRDSVVPTLVLALLLAVYLRRVDQSIGLPSMFNEPNRQVRGFVVGVLSLRLGYLWMAFKTLLVALGYLSLCMAPLLPMIVRGRSNWRRPLTAFAIAALVAIVLVVLGRARPLPANTFFDFGLGVRTLPSEGTARTAAPGFWWAMAFVVGMGTAASIFAAASLRWTRAAIRPSAAATRNACTAMLITTLCLYNVPFLMLGGIWFDRYTLPNIALFGILVAPFLELSRATKAGLALTTALLTAYFAFGVAGTHDYIEWNRQRWLAAEALVREEGIDAAQIDGGFEYNNYQARVAGDRHRPPETVILQRPDARYRLALSPLAGHTLVSMRVCNTWLYGSPDAVYALKAPASAGVR